MRRFILSLIFVLALLGNGEGLAASKGSVTLVINGATHTLEAELAITPEERKQGLMNRYDFGSDDAMLFVFPSERILSFWMKDTPISLDIIYFDKDGHWLNTHSRTKPFSLVNLHSAGPALYALELAGGEAARLNIGRGTRLKFALE